MGVPEGEEREEFENKFEKNNDRKAPNLVKEIGMQVQEVQTVPNKMNPKRPVPRHSIIKMPKVKDKERLLKAAREKQLVSYEEVPIRLSADFSKETLQSRSDCQELFKVMKNKELQPRVLHPEKPAFRIKGQIKNSPERKS